MDQFIEETELAAISKADESGFRAFIMGGPFGRVAEGWMKTW